MARPSDQVPGAFADPLWLRWLLIGSAVLLVALVVLMPLAVVIVEAAAAGWDAYLDAVGEPDTFAAIKLTLLVAVLCVPANIVFGISAAWAITRACIAVVFSETTQPTMVRLPAEICIPSGQPEMFTLSSAICAPTTSPIAHVSIRHPDI